MTRIIKEQPYLHGRFILRESENMETSLKTRSVELDEGEGRRNPKLLYIELSDRFALHHPDHRPEFFSAYLGLNAASQMRVLGWLYTADILDVEKPVALRFSGDVRMTVYQSAKRMLSSQEFESKVRPRAYWLDGYGSILLLDPINAKPDSFQLRYGSFCNFWSLHLNLVEALQQLEQDTPLSFDWLTDVESLLLLNWDKPFYTLLFNLQELCENEPEGLSVHALHWLLGLISGYPLDGNLQLASHETHPKMRGK